MTLRTYLFFAFVLSCESDILQLGHLASEVIFSPRKRLTVHSSMDYDDKVSEHSSGDGAWIMNSKFDTQQWFLPSLKRFSQLLNILYN